MPAVVAAANAAPITNLYIIVGTRNGVVFRFEKGSFAPTALVLRDVLTASPDHSERRR